MVAKPPETIATEPCLTEAATLLLDALLSRRNHVWEFGSGGSTLWFAKRAKSVTSIEDNQPWRDAVAAALLEHEFDNVDLRLSPTKALPDTIEPEGEFHLVFVDCLTQNERRRAVLLGSQHVKPGGWLVADDYNFPMTREAVDTLSARGWSVGIVVGTKIHPVRRVVVKTSTAFCHRPEEQ